VWRKPCPSRGPRVDRAQYPVVENVPDDRREFLNRKIAGHVLDYYLSIVSHKSCFPIGPNGLRTLFVVKLVMTKNRKSSRINPSARTLGDRTFAAISAVEGLKMSHDSSQRLRSMKARDLSPSQMRAEILRTYRTPKGG
jgi:hypothetical protein